MKKLRYFAVFILFLTFTLLSTACNEKLLDTPTGFNIDDAYTMYWKSVKDARKYELDITNVDNGMTKTSDSRKTYFSFAEFPEGKYEIKVRAVGGMNNELYSPWSDVVELERLRESGLIFRSINGSTEYAVSKVGTAAGALEIESYYRGKPVTVIDNDAFRGKGSSRIESVVIGSNVRTIGEGAFYNCTKLQSVTIPESVVSIGASAFQGCNALKSVKLPSGLTQISDYLFAYCRGLEKVEMGDSVEYFGESAFFRCSELKEVEIPDSVVYIGQHTFEEATSLEHITFGSGLQAIDEYAFYKCTALKEVTFGEEITDLVFADHVFDSCSALEEIALPEGLTEIGGYDFYRCKSLETVTIPKSVKRVGEFAFRDTALYKEQSESGDGFIYADDWLVAATDELKVNITQLTSESLRPNVYGIADQTFIVNVTTSQGARITTGAPQLKSIEIPASIHYIGIYAFYKCPILEKVTAEAGSELVAIGDRAFQGCAILRNVQFEAGLEEIGSYAFMSCTVLASNNKLVPSTVNRIGTYAFKDTGLWTSAANNGGIVYAGNWVVGFNGLTDTSVDFRLPDGDPVRGVADFAFYQNADVQNITGLSGARHIGRGAFFGCASLTQISLNQNLTRIEDNTFSGCSSLFNVDLPFNLENIGLRAFYNCTMLNEINLSLTEITEVGDMAFYGCFNVKKIQLNEKLKTIGARAFCGLNQIEILVIPDSVETIGAYAFANCTKLGTLTFGSETEGETSLTEIGIGAFSGCMELEEVSFPTSVESIGDYAFYKCMLLKRINFGDGVKNIGSYAFARTAIRSLVLPSCVETIGNYAFKNCKRLNSVVIAGKPIEIGVHAFYGSSTLTIYIAEDSADSLTWNSRWNSAFRPVIWNCTLSEDGDYLVSFTVEFENVTNPFARFGVSEPMRAGYHFVGWALTPNGEVVYGVDEWRNAEMGSTLYAVWEEGEPEDPEEPKKPEVTEQLTESPSTENPGAES